jgi:hypothetical protein
MLDLYIEIGEVYEVAKEIIKQAYEFPLVTLSVALESLILELTLK